MGAANRQHQRDGTPALPQRAAATPSRLVLYTAFEKRLGYLESSSVSRSVGVRLRFIGEQAVCCICDQRPLYWESGMSFPAIKNRVLRCLVSCLFGMFVFNGLETQVACGQGDPDGLKNQAETSTLPSGLGFASKFGWDKDLGRDSRVLFFEDFETAEFRQRWGDVRDDEGEVLERIEVPLNSPDVGNHALQITSNLEKNTGGGLTVWFESRPKLFIRFYVKFDKDCDYIHHFCTLRANVANRGRDAWSGFGGAGVRPDGTERFSTAIEPFGDWGKLTPPGKWNFYSYWYEMSASPDGKYWGNAFRPQTQPLIPRDQWICVEMMLTHNTPGQPDCEQAFWIDGKLVGHWTGIPWRKIEQLKANAFTLESYVTDRWTKQKMNRVWFDQVVIASEYIGPMAKP